MIPDTTGQVGIGTRLERVKEICTNGSEDY